MTQLTHRFSRALVFAAELHKDQRRKSGNIPYVSHLLAVTALVLEHGGSEDVAIAALLHDALEDQGANYQGQFCLRLRGPAALRDDIHFIAGAKVLAITEELTETDVDPKPPWRERKEAYLAHLAKASPEAVLVAAADKLHNARCTLEDFWAEGSEACWAKFNADKASQRWWYHELLQIFRQRPDVPERLYRELALVVSQLFP